MRKQFFTLVFGVIVFLFLFVGCQDEYLADEGVVSGLSTKSAVTAISYCGDEVVHDLIADQDLVVGSVTVGNDGEKLYVTFEVTGDWLLANTKVFIGDDPADIPVNRAGNPVRGKFPEDTDHDPYATVWTYEFDLGDAEPGDPMVVVAHADVLTLGEVDGIVVVTREETAWGWGETSFDGKSWGWYSTYVVQECTGCPDHIILLQMNIPWGWWGCEGYDGIMESMGMVPGTGPGTYQIAGISELYTMSLDPAHDLVVLVGEQGDYFYYHFLYNQARFWNFVEAGGNFMVVAAKSGDFPCSQFLWPLNVSCVNTNENYNYIPDGSLPLVEGIPSPCHGSYASHTSFSNLPAESIVYCVDSEARATLFEYSFGSGKLLISGQPLEYAFQFGQDLAPVLPRALAYLTCTPMPETMEVMAVKSAKEVPPSYTGN